MNGPIGQRIHDAGQPRIFDGQLLPALDAFDDSIWAQPAARAPEACPVLK